MKMNGADIIIHLLERQNVQTIAGIPGGANLPLYNALAQSRKIRHILTRHEQGAGFIAQGIARVSGRPEVCFATSGPGATNMLTAIADAKLDSIPIICITGQVPSDLIGTDAFQEVDTYGLSIPITKHNFLVRSPEELLSVIPEAFRIAASGRPGPVLLDIPKDIQTGEASFDHWPEPGRPDTLTPIEPSLIEAAADMINRARRPVLYIGGGIIHSDAVAQVRCIAQKAKIPTTMSLMGLGAMPSNHSLSLGMVGMHAARYTNMALAECDLLIAAGARFDDRATGKVPAFCPNAQIIHIDIDPCELNKIKTAHIAIRGDMKTALEALEPQVKPRSIGPWQQRISSLKARFSLEASKGNNPLSPFNLIRQAAACLDDEAVIVTDVGQHQMWTAQAYPFSRPGQLLTSGGLGTMGFGLPVALGAALAAPHRQVICFSGDGSIMMNIQEMATAVEENVNIKIILMNNNSLGLVHQQQELFYNQRIYASDYRRPMDFIRIADGFGMHTMDLAELPDPKSALETAFHQDGPCLIHVPIDINEHVYPMVPPGASNTEMIGGGIHAEQ